MRFLLDTHTLLWAGAQPELLGREAAALITGEGNEILVSSASAWEMATKVRLGKWPEAVQMEANLLELVEANGYTFLPIAPGIALRAGRLAGEHRDPFDRMLAAHALAEDIPILSADAKLDGFGVRRIW